MTGGFLGLWAVVNSVKNIGMELGGINPEESYVWYAGI
jgi:hypothetical protein